MKMNSPMSEAGPAGPADGRFGLSQTRSTNRTEEAELNCFISAHSQSERGGRLLNCGPTFCILTL